MDGGMVFAAQGGGHAVALPAGGASVRSRGKRWASFAEVDPSTLKPALVAAALARPGVVVDGEGRECAVNAYGICIPVEAFSEELAHLSSPLAALLEADPQRAFDVCAAAIRSARGVPWRFDTPDAWREVAGYGRP